MTAWDCDLGQFPTCNSICVQCGSNIRPCEQKSDNVLTLFTLHSDNVKYYSDIVCKNIITMFINIAFCTILYSSDVIYHSFDIVYILTIFNNILNLFAIVNCLCLWKKCSFWQYKSAIFFIFYINILSWLFSNWLGSRR